VIRCRTLPLKAWVGINAPENVEPMGSGVGDAGKENRKAESCVESCP